MFYEGSLQSGIASAVDQQKLVFCFVTNENEESKAWEDEFLQDGSLRELIQGKAVALKLQAGSEEAGYLGQIFPLPQTPTIVIMKHGELKEYIAPGTTKEDFMRRVQSTFNASSQGATSSSAGPATTPPAAVPAAASAQPDSSPAASSSQTDRSDNVRRILAERAARLQVQKEEEERKAKAEHVKNKEKAKADAEAGIDNHAARTHKQAELVKKNRLKATEERQRILKRIEDDKKERQLRTAERDQQRIDKIKTGDVAGSLANAPETKLPSTTRVGAMTSLQVRLFDGSTIRSRFKTASTVKEVRKWVDETKDGGNTPYTFKKMLTPLPNQNIDVTEESKTLGELGLAPSSTLVLIPVQDYSSAYADGSDNIFSKIIALIVALFTWLGALLGLSGGPAATQQTPQQDQRDPVLAAQERERRIRGLQNSNDQRRDQQLYNGNSLNFEPRPDEDENEK